LYNKIRAFFSSRAINSIVFFLLACCGVFLFIIMERYARLSAVANLVASVPWFGICLVASFPFVVYGIAALRWKYILRGYGYAIAYKKLLRASLESTAVSIILPSFQISGETYKAVETQKWGVSKPAAFASVFFDFFIVFCVNTIGGFALLAYIIIKGWRGISLVSGIGTVVFLIVGILLARMVVKPGWFTRMMKKSVPLDERNLESVGLFDYGISFFMKNALRYAYIGVAISAIGFFWEVVQLSIVASFVGIGITPLAIAVLYVVINFFNSVPVFGGIGFGEAGAFLAGASLAIPDAQSMALMALLRLRQVVILVVGGGSIAISRIYKKLWPMPKTL